MVHTGNIGRYYRMRLFSFWTPNKNVYLYTYCSKFKIFFIFQGCFKILLNMAMEKFNIVIAIVIAVLAVEIIAIFLAFCLAKMSSRQRKRWIILN